MKTAKLHCPKCNSHKIRSIDNDPIYHQPKAESEKEEYSWQVDGVINIKLTCDNCQYELWEEFEIKTGIKLHDMG
jgi:predicted nucleic-acid-binding Zn-ribbon protein